MLRKIDHKKMGYSNLGWLNSLFHFSFAEYYNPQNIHFGVLRVVNDDLVKAGYGFDMHPHNDMEIISYVIDGELTHRDDMGNAQTLTRGQIQYMSAGTGVNHSEYNLAKNTLRLLQIWIYPDKKGYQPSYGDFRFDWQARQNKWLHLVSSYDGSAPVKIHQDVNIYALELADGHQIEFEVNTFRQAYLIQIEGESDINNIEVKMRDAVEIIDDQITITAINDSHFLLIEMAYQPKE